MKSAIAVVSLLVGLFSPVFAELPPEELVKRQARSVHLSYSPLATNATAAVGTVTVTETQTNTYFCILAWDGGYCGIQDKASQGRVLIFSVWDSKELPAAGGCEGDCRAKVLFAAPNVDVARFGGEGTGMRTIMPVGWEVGVPVTVRIETASDGARRTVYTCFLKNDADDGWRRVAAISAYRDPRVRRFGQVYSFVEDFWRNTVSAGLVRRAEFSRIATCGAGEVWTKASRARFTADKTPSSAIDAGCLADGTFFLQTGGATTNAHARLLSTFGATPRELRL